MILFNTYRDNPYAPLIYVTNFGGMYRAGNDLIKVTAINEVPNAAGQMEAVAAVSLLWPVKALISAIYLSRYAQREFLRGGFDKVEPFSLKN